MLTHWAQRDARAINNHMKNTGDIAPTYPKIYFGDSIKLIEFVLGKSMRTEPKGTFQLSNLWKLFFGKENIDENSVHTAEYDTFMLRDVIRFLICWANEQHKQPSVSITLSNAIDLYKKRGRNMTRDSQATFFSIFFSYRIFGSKKNKEKDFWTNMKDLVAEDEGSDEEKLDSKVDVKHIQQLPAPPLIEPIAVIKNNGIKEEKKVAKYIVYRCFIENRLPTYGTALTSRNANPKVHFLDCRYIRDDGGKLYESVKHDISFASTRDYCSSCTRMSIDHETYQQQPKWIKETVTMGTLDPSIIVHILEKNNPEPTSNFK
jgi:hypothetical protein